MRFITIKVFGDKEVDVNLAHVRSLWIDDRSGRTVIEMADGSRYETTEKKFEIIARADQEARIVELDIHPTSRLSSFLSSILKNLER